MGGAPGVAKRIDRARAGGYGRRMRVLLLLLLAGCTPTGHGKLQLKAGASFANAQSCGGDAGACTMPMVCAVLDLASGAAGPICVPLAVCAQLSCSEDYCVFESTDTDGVFSVDCAVPQ